VFTDLPHCHQPESDIGKLQRQNQVVFNWRQFISISFGVVQVLVLDAKEVGIRKIEPVGDLADQRVTPVVGNEHKLQCADRVGRRAAVSVLHPGVEQDRHLEFPVELLCAADHRALPLCGLHVDEQVVAAPHQLGHVAVRRPGDPVPRHGHNQRLTLDQQLVQVLPRQQLYSAQLLHSGRIVGGRQHHLV